MQLSVLQVSNTERPILHKVCFASRLSRLNLPRRRFQCSLFAHLGHGRGGVAGAFRRFKIRPENRKKSVRNAPKIGSKIDPHDYGRFVRPVFYQCFGEKT